MTAEVCLFCVHYIVEQMNGKCPACRQATNHPLFKMKDNHQTTINQLDKMGKTLDVRTMSSLSSGMMPASA